MQEEKQKEGRQNKTWEEFFLSLVAMHLNHLLGMYIVSLYFIMKQ